MMYYYRNAINQLYHLINIHIFIYVRHVFIFQGSNKHTFIYVLINLYSVVQYKEYFWKLNIRRDI